MSSTRNRILSAALLLPVVLFSTAWTSFALWRCGSDGVARTACCCPNKTPKATVAQAVDSGSGPAISGSGCCQLEQYQLDKAPAEVARANAAQLTALVAIATAAILVALLPLPEPAAQDLPAAPPDRDGAPAGRALVLHKHAFLI